MVTFPCFPALWLALVGVAAAQQDPAPTVPPAPVVPTELEAVVAAVFRDPAFQQRFAESYAAVTEVEPKVTAKERDVLAQVSELLATPAEQGGPQAERAMDLLRSRVTPTASAVFDFTLGQLLFQRDQLPEAVVAYEAATKKAPRFLRAFRGLGFVQMKRGDHRTAARAFARVLELGGGDAATYGLLGFALGQNEDHLAAESAFRMAVLLDPLTLDWRMGLARALLRQRRFAEAAALCGALIAGNPDRADLWLHQANAFVGMNEPRKAVENLEMVDRLGQSTAESLAMLGDIYINEELADLAAGAYLRAMAKDQKGNPDRAVRAAKALVARNAHGEGAKLLDGIEATYGGKLSDAVQKDLLKLRARLAVANGAGDEEAKVLEQIVALDPLDGEALILLGQYHGRKGDSERAVLQYERAAGIVAFEADAKVRHAQLLVGQGKYAEALPLLKRAQQVKPRDNIQQFLDQVERITQNK